jgi:taurine dioxygenase
MWASLHAAYDLLSPGMQRIADDLRQAVHPGEGLRETLRVQFGEGIWEQVTHLYQGTTHPLVRVHPETDRRALFLCGAYFQGLEGLTESESASLMEIFRAPLCEPAIQCRWRWSEGDLAIWDERCTNHRGLGDHYPQHRIVRRCTVGGARPVGPEGAS